MSTPSGITRRRFLASTATAAALPMIVPSSVFGANAPSERIELAGIGVGGRGTGNVRNLMNHKEIQLVATCDADLLKAQSLAKYGEGKQKKKGIKAYQDYRELLAKTPCDAVMIATPDHLHAVVGIACANAGKDIYGEKPFARYIKEGRALVNAVERNGVIWQTGSWQRSGWSFRHACELVRNGHMGKITKITIGLPAGWAGGDPTPKPIPETFNHDLWLGPAPWNPYRPGKNQATYSWRLISDYGGGKLLDWIGHHGDIAQWGLGRDRSGPCKCTPGKITYPTEGLFDTPIQYKYTLEYDDGIQVEIGDSKQVPMGCRFWNDKGEWLFVTRGKFDASNKALLKTVIGPGEIRLYDSKSHDGNWIDCIKSRKQTITPAETAHRSVTLGHLCLIAERLGRTINFDPKTESFPNDPAAQALTQRAYRAGWELPL